MHVIQTKSIRWEAADWRRRMPHHPLLAVAIDEFAIVICLVS
jgi:hypothetical protein